MNKFKKSILGLSTLCVTSTAMMSCNQTTQKLRVTTFELQANPDKVGRYYATDKLILTLAGSSPKAEQRKDTLLLFCYNQELLSGHQSIGTLSDVYHDLHVSDRHYQFDADTYKTMKEALESNNLFYGARNKKMLSFHHNSVQ